MPTALSPPSWRMTQHALDRMEERGIDRARVLAVLDEPSFTYDHERDPTLRLAGGDGLLIPFNIFTGDVVTVMEPSDQDKEQPMSGWINLDARQAEKLLQDWGFQIHSTKNNFNLWTHPIDDEARLIPFSIPGRGARANGKGSFRTAAQVVGVNVNEFLKGPGDEWRERVALLQKVKDAKHLLDAPDPLGINVRVAEQMSAEVDAGIMVQAARLKNTAAVPAATATQEAPVPKNEPEITYAPVEEKVLAGLLEATAPVTGKQLAATLGIHYVSAGDGLRKAVRLGDAYIVGKTEPKAGGGKPAALFWYEPTFTATEPEPEPTPQETPMPDQRNVIEGGYARVIDLAEPAPAAQKLFTATGSSWPTGGILIQDEDGVFYVARKLVEEGR